MEKGHRNLKERKDPLLIDEEEEEEEEETDEEERGVGRVIVSLPSSVTLPSTLFTLCDIDSE